MSGGCAAPTPCGLTLTGAYAESVRVAPCDRPAGHAGFCWFRAMTTGARRRTSDETRYRMGATRLQMEVGEYRRQVEAGNRWCSGHQGWEPSETFGSHVRRGLNTRCRVADREASGHASSRRVEQGRVAG
jgi:hypothetical protein